MISIDVENDGQESSVESRQLEALKQRLTPWHPNGNLKVFCHGWIVVNPIRPWWWILETYVVAITAVFFTERKQYNETLTITGIFLGVISLFFCLIVTFKNPGVLEKPTFEDAVRNAMEASRRPSHIKHTTDKNGITRLNFYCSMCHIFRTRFSHHCQTCDCCIADWDHHCSIIGICVSGKTRWAVYSMTLSLLMMWVFYLFASLYAAITAGHRQHKFISIAESVTFLMILAGIVGWCILPPIVYAVLFRLVWMGPNRVAQERPHEDF